MDSCPSSREKEALRCRAWWQQPHYQCDSLRFLSVEFCSAGLVLRLSLSKKTEEGRWQLGSWHCSHRKWWPLRTWLWTLLRKNGPAEPISGEAVQRHDARKHQSLALPWVWALKSDVTSQLVQGEELRWGGRRFPQGQRLGWKVLKTRT